MIFTPKKYQLKSKIDLQGLGVEPSKFGLHSQRPGGATLVATRFHFTLNNKKDHLLSSTAVVSLKGASIKFVF